MKLHQLKSAVAIVNCDMNLTQAAKALNATQPGISTHIRLLEAELGLTLFVRHHKRFVGLTPAGRALLPIAIRAVGSIAELESAAKQLSSPLERSIVIAASPARSHALGKTLNSFRSQYPKTKIRILSGNVSEVLSAVTKGEADVCLVTSSPDLPSNFAFTKAYAVGWYLVAPKGHEATLMSKPTLEHISAFPLVTYDENFTSRSLLVKAFRNRGLEPSIVLSVGNCESMMQYSLAGAGVAIVRTAAEEVDNIPGLVSIPLDHILPTSNVCIGTRHGMNIDAPLRYLLKLLQIPPGRGVVTESPPNARMTPRNVSKQLQISNKVTA